MERLVNLPRNGGELVGIACQEIQGILEKIYGIAVFEDGPDAGRRNAIEFSSSLPFALVRARPLQPALVDAVLSRLLGKLSSSLKMCGFALGAVEGLAAGSATARDNASSASCWGAAFANPFTPCMAHYQ